MNILWAAKSYLLTSIVTLSLLTISPLTMATPAFARQQHMECGGCHTAFPSLNKLGRDYKTQGYRFNDASNNKTITSFTDMVNQFPIAAAIISRPYVKEKGEDKEIRAIHEIELFAGGVLYKNVSGFVEIESEGEDGFGLVLGATALNYDVNNALHFQLAYAPSFFADPYDTLSDARRLTATHYNITNDEFTGIDPEMRHARQQASVFGRVGKVYYNAGLGGLTEDKTGSDSTVYFGRLAYDISNNLMIGAFGLSGTCEVTEVSDNPEEDCSIAARDFNRYGIDSQAILNAFHLSAVYMSYEVDSADVSSSESNDVWYVQGAYYSSADATPLFVPLLRYESTQSNDGRDTTNSLIANLTHYFTKNAKGMIELEGDVSVPSGAHKHNGGTLQFEVAF